MTAKRSKYLCRYRVTYVDGACTGRVAIGTVMVDERRHAADGATSWTFMSTATGEITGTISAEFIGTVLRSEVQRQLALPAEEKGAA